MRFQDGNSTIIGLNYISEPWNSLEVRREREREREMEEQEGNRTRGRDFLCKFFSRLSQHVSLIRTECSEVS